MTEEQQFNPGSIKKAAQASGFRSADLWKCPVDKLRVVDGFNVRDKDAAYRERVEYICNSIIENGYMDDKPIAGFVSEEGGEHTVIVTDGHTRYDAVLLAISKGHPITELPVVTKPRGTSMEDLTVALVTSNTGEKLRPYEVAKVCKRLIGYGMSETDIAKRLGLTRAYVIDLLALLASPELSPMERQGAIDRAAAPVNSDGEPLPAPKRGAILARLLARDEIEISLMYLALLGAAKDPSYALGRLADHVKYYRSPIIRNTIDAAEYEKELSGS
jgi:ParB-like chromosome segregation protein Spo0J